MSKLLLELSFVGTRYHGWQAQNNAITVQKTVQNAVEALLLAPCKVTGCSRTDAGVHALLYVCTVESEALSSFQTENFVRAVNTFLPKDVKAQKAVLKEDSFHPRYSARRKEYEYRIFDRETPDPFFSDFAWHIKTGRLDEKKMEEGAKCLMGTHDFSSFCAAGSEIEDKTRTIYQVTVRRTDHLICVAVEGDGFLYHMVRILVGTLVDYAQGKIESIEEVLEKKDRSFAGRTAPAQGLYLKNITY